MRSCQLYLVDPLTHSVPYLTKGARSLLEDLGEGFQYILRREGYRPHRIIVTSLILGTRKQRAIKNHHLRRG